MRRLIGSALIAVLGVMILGCGSSAETEAAAEAVPAETSDAITIDNAFYYTHINGHAKETETLAFVLFEYEQLSSVKYQVAYIACTCRGPEVNYYSVAYVELDKNDGSVKFLSYDEDSTGHYTAGMYGDSTFTYEGVPAKELYEQFRKERLIGASQDEINAIEAMHGDVDAYTGATVTPNNAVSMLQGLFEYHNARY